VTDTLVQISEVWRPPASCQIVHKKTSVWHKYSHFQSVEGACQIVQNRNFSTAQTFQFPTCEVTCRIVHYST